MKRVLIFVLTSVFLVPSAAFAEFREVDLTIFGMD